jgi:hypothetical protein
MANAEKPNQRRRQSRVRKINTGGFQQTARELGVDDEESAEQFEAAFRKIVPPKPRSA